MPEMSGRFLANGHELTVDELEEFRARNREERADHRLTCCKMSFFWFGHALGLPETFDLSSMLRRIAVEGSAFLYNEPRLIAKANGGTRIIITPKPELMLVQSRINRLLARTFPRQPGTFGYRGGSCKEVAERHAPFASTLKFDIKDAFFRVEWTTLRTLLRGCKNPRFPKPGFSSSISYWIAKLCTYSPLPEIVTQRFPYIRSFLPQGAPTSPICFDLACTKLDDKLARIAHRVGGIVSRYADNYFFSMPTSRTSRKLIRMVMKDASRRGFPVHKVRRIDQDELCRILGYNVKSGKVSNTRDYRRKLRGALYVLRTKLDRGLDWEAELPRVRGLMGFTVNLPDDLKASYELCEKKIAELS